MMSDASPMQESLQTFQAAPGAPGPARFRPYASTVHHVTKGRYITSNDARGYIPVYEYPLNNQWIMMDIDDGYILWTGIWKALGNSKADIVKMIDSQPDLAHVIRRVRGGYLKIQGTWMPYDVALNLARRVAWNIRDDLVPLFGPTFPSTCLSPDQPGYGQVVASASSRRRARRSHIQPLVPAQENHSNPSVFTQGRPSSFGHAALPPLSAPPRERHRYAPYPISPVSDIQQHMLPPPRRSSASSLLDLPGLRAAHPPPSPLMNSPARLPIHLPAIQTHLPRGPSNDSVYALPPISALEDLRGVETHDAAAVLRRLNSDDDADSHRRPGRRALSVPAPRMPSPPAANAHRRSMGELPGPAALRLRVPPGSALSESDTSGSSPSSPASPATPRSAISVPRDHAGHLALVPLSVLKEQQQTRHHRDSAFANSYCLPATFGNSSWLADRDEPPSSSCRRFGREASDGSSGCASPSPFVSW